MKKLYTSIKIIALLFVVNNLFAQSACFTATEFPVGALHCQGISFIFSDCSVGATSWNWDFGAGAVPQYSNQQNPGIVNFPICNLNQQVTLVINGGVSSATQIIPIYCNPVACFTVNSPFVCAGTPECFNISCSQVGAGSSSLTYMWDVGNGQQLTNANPCYTYPEDSGCFSIGLIVTNNHGCTDFVSEPNAVCIIDSPCLQPPIISEVISNEYCNQSNGAIDIFITNGTPPYTYVWSNGVTTEDLMSLISGSYTVTVMDFNNLLSISSFFVLNISGPTINENHTDEMCDNANGAINISVSNGVAPFSYQWSNGTTTEDLNNLSEGNYSVTVFDSTNCTATLSIPIVNHPAPTITVSHVDASCLNCHDGSATVFISGGGTSPYTIQWNIGSTSNPIINLDPGTYVVCVTDANGCSVCDSTVVGNADGIIPINANESVLVIPNPSNGIFTLEFSNSIQLENIEILNMIGEKVFSSMFRQAQQDKVQIDFISGVSGIYFLQIKTVNGIIRKKILINQL